MKKKTTTETSDESPLMSNRSHANLVKLAKKELVGKTVAETFKKLVPMAYGRLRGHFDYGKKREHAEDFATMALADACGAAKRMSEFRADW